MNNLYKSLKLLAMTMSLMLFMVNNVEAQKRFNLTTSTVSQNETIIHNGNIGIGSLITSPAHKLHVEGAIRISDKPPLGFGGPVLMFENQVGNNGYGDYAIEFLPNQGLNFGLPWGSSTGSFSNYDLLLSNTHKVGMGVNDFTCSDCSDYRLFVKDGIKTEKVKVEVASVAGWADYVFANDYSLMSLDKLQNFINENGHLPDVPTAEEVVENGFELKEMNVLLLKKVEELTLYLLNQEKRIKDLEKKANQ
jgi:hypothetical protein